MADCKIRNVYAGIAGSHIRSFNSSGMVAIKDKEVTATDVARVIETAKASTSDRPAAAAHGAAGIIVNQEDVREPIGMSGIRLEVRCTSSPAPCRPCRTSSSACAAAAWKSDLILQPMASADAVLTADEKELGVVLIDIGGGTTDVAVFSEARSVTRP
jgi:cell division protein FtsA